MVLNGAPDNHVVHRIVTMDDAVAEIHDVPQRGDTGGNGGSQTIDGTSFNVYTLGVSTLFVEAEIDSLLA